MTWFRVGGAGIPAALKNAMNAVFNKKFGTTGQNYPPNGWPNDVNLMGPLPEKTVAGAIVNVDDAADSVPVKSMVCSIVAKQEGSGTPSASNPRAISGYTGLTLIHAGQNLLFQKDCSFQVGNMGFEVVDGVLSLTGTLTSGISSLAQGFKDNLSFILPAGTYYFYFPYAIWPAGSYGRSASVYPKNAAAGADALVANSGSFTLTETTELFIGLYIGAGADLDEFKPAAYLYLGSAASQYVEPKFQPKIVDSWSSIGTVYGGERNLTDGSLKVTHGYIASYNGEAINEPWISNIDEYVPGTTPSTGAQVVYPLTTPVNYSNLESYIIETILGANNFYTDVFNGQIQMTYRQDIALALQAVSSSRGLMMASRPVTQLIGEESDPDQVNELVENDEDVLPEQLSEFVENDEIEQEGENDAR